MSSSILNFHLKRDDIETNIQNTFSGQAQIFSYICDI